MQLLLFYQAFKVVYNNCAILIRVPIILRAALFYFVSPSFELKTFFVFSTKHVVCVAVLPGVVKCGAYDYQDGTRYVGDWNAKGQKHGMGHLVLPDGTRYDGAFTNGLCGGLGVMNFPDGAKYAIN